MRKIYLHNQFKNYFMKRIFILAYSLIWASGVFAKGSSNFNEKRTVVER
jgi:hypothetical protein